MSLKLEDWKLLCAVTDGKPLTIEGCDVWLSKWNSLKLGTLEVPHPSYPAQRHKLWPYHIDRDGTAVLFLAGELSNGVWCFYVPAKGQPAETCKGMTINERLVLLGLSDLFDTTIAERDKTRAVSVLIASGLNRAQADESVAAILADPGKYEY